LSQSAQRFDHAESPRLASSRRADNYLRCFLASPEPFVGSGTRQQRLFVWLKGQRVPDLAQLGPDGGPLPGEILDLATSGRHLAIHGSPQFGHFVRGGDAQVDTWVGRAASAASVKDLFD